MCSGSKALWPHGVVKSNMLLAKVVYKLCLCPCLIFAQCTCAEQPEVPIYKVYSLPHCLQRFILNPELLSGNTWVLGTQRLYHPYHSFLVEGTILSGFPENCSFHMMSAICVPMPLNHAACQEWGVMGCKVALVFWRYFQNFFLQFQR